MKLINRKSLLLSTFLVTQVVFFSPKIFAATTATDCPYNATNYITTSTPLNITTQIAGDTYKAAVADCASGATVNISNTGSIVSKTIGSLSSGSLYGFLVPSTNLTTPPVTYLGDQTGTLNNQGSIISNSQNYAHAVHLDAAFGTIINGSDSVLGRAALIQAQGIGSVGVFINYVGTSGLLNPAPGGLDLLRNYGLISGVTAVSASSNVNTIQNYGSITATGNGIYAVRGIIGEVSNEGTITGGASGGIAVRSSGGYGTITTINNYGSIIATGGGFGIVTAYVDPANHGTITTLNNQQGAGNSNGALTYTGYLPTNYNIIIKGPSQYGQLSVTTPSGSMGFGILAGSVVANNTRYVNVLQGFSTLGSVTNQTGTYNTYNYSLVANSSLANAWDLCFGDCVAPAPPTPPGPSTADTQQSLVNTASQLQNTYTLQNSVLANSFSYDCTLFDKNNICISAGGRNTQVSAANGLNNTSGLLIAAYRPHANYRIGAYADQNLSVNNAGSTVNLGNNTPLIGLFGAWNERLDGTGTEVKVSAAYGQKNTTITRSVVGTSEAGSGGSQLNSQGAQVVAKYGFGVMPDVVVSPYAGIRYTQNNMGGYTESTSSAVTAPLTYSALNTNATTALAGVGASYRGIPQTNLFASAGVETDTNTANGSVSATGVTGLTPVNFNANPVKTRPTAMVGATYDVAKNQRLGVTGIYRQEAYQAVQTTTVMATYTVGL